MKTGIKLNKRQCEFALQLLNEEYDEGLIGWADYSAETRPLEQRLASLKEGKKVILTD